MVIDKDNHWVLDTGTNGPNGISQGEDSTLRTRGENTVDTVTEDGVSLKVMVSM